MGEYATVAGKQVKIGTCEDMYYLRWDQVHLVQSLAHSLNPTDRDVLKVIRFRFPWPQEDGTLPGAFDDYDKAVAVPDAPMAAMDHYSVQFSAAAGYLLCVPCPEGPNAPAGIMRNGWRGRVLLTQQAWRGGWLAPVFRCGGCGAAWSEPDPDAARKMFSGMIEEAERMEKEAETWKLPIDSRAIWYREVVRRALAGAPAPVGVPS